MWNTRIEKLADGRVIRVVIDLGETTVSYADVLRHWQDDADFRSMFNGVLADSTFTAFRWETPPITTVTANRPFEFVMIDSPGLARNPDAEVFAEHFNKDAVVDFPNLGKDAIMVVPCPIGPLSAYGHLGAFVRNAPESQRHALWQIVSAATQRRLSSKPVWLSTAGAGVSWLHVRLDDQPKYYGYAPYRSVS